MNEQLKAQPSLSLNATGDTGSTSPTVAPLKGFALLAARSRNNSRPNTWSSGQSAKKPVTPPLETPAKAPKSLHSTSQRPPVPGKGAQSGTVAIADASRANGDSRRMDSRPHDIPTSDGSQVQTASDGFMRIADAPPLSADHHGDSQEVDDHTLLAPEARPLRSTQNLDALDVHATRRSEDAINLPLEDDPHPLLRGQDDGDPRFDGHSLPITEHRQRQVVDAHSLLEGDAVPLLDDIALPLHESEDKKASKSEYLPLPEGMRALDPGIDDHSLPEDRSLSLAGKMGPFPGWARPPAYRYLDPVELAESEARRVLLLKQARPGESTIRRYQSILGRLEKGRSITIGSAGYAWAIHSAIRFTLEDLVRQSHTPIAIVHAVNMLDDYLLAVRQKELPSDDVFFPLVTDPVSPQLTRIEEIANWLGWRLDVNIEIPAELASRYPRKRKLKNLPADQDFRLEVLEEVRRQCRIPGAYLAIVVLCLTGCRPSQIATAEVKQLPDGRVEVTVLSVKQRGPAFRHGAIYDSSTLTDALLMTANPTTHAVFDSDAPSEKQIENLLKRVSLGLFPKLAPVISASDFRNQIASDFKLSAKLSGTPKAIWTVALARLLGHSTTEQQKDYGDARRGKKGSLFLPYRVLDSHSIRVVDTLAESNVRARPSSPHAFDAMELV